ncbi:unnamed protein product [Microthlaspi erraticum]|uniref:NAC domain-containing protein n=1 Tax=Microthlaspi erraticum TaxID=1685480 RepID=A0A6D2HRX2_9BRAS|nr:unnamed protein product [Microthlaspi erraticum]
MDALSLAVRFAPTEQEIFERFLFPRLAGDEEALRNSLVQFFELYDQDPTAAAFPPQPYFLANNHYFFVNRAPLTPASSQPYREIDNLASQGRWKMVGKPKIVKRGNTIILGKRNTLDFVTVEGKRTGWRQYEYERILDAPIFQTVVVVHIFYQPGLNQNADVNQLGDV